ncbi:MAG: glycosyltransferase [Candidatus Binataceae bacterium]
MGRKVALVADKLVDLSGQEKVFKVICDAFPDADIVTSIYIPQSTLPEFSSRNIYQLVPQRPFRDWKTVQRYYPLAAALMMRRSLRGYDTIVSSVAHLGRYIRKGSARHISYTYYPFRLLYEDDKYPQVTGFSRQVMRAMLPALRRWDRYQAGTVDRFVAISESSRAAIRRYYGRDSDVIPSPILDLPREHEPARKGDYYLVVSRLEPWKELEVVIDAFSTIRRNLVVIGEGPEIERLRARARSSVKFVGRVSQSELADYYRGARALIHPTPTEYGLTPIEANAYGTAAICLGTGGVFETMIPYEAGAKNATALFYETSRSEVLADAVLRFERIETEFDPHCCVENAGRFAPEVFVERLRAYVEQWG